MHRRASSSVALKKVFIANRGEIACRIVKTANRLGIPTVAAWVDADKEAMHVRMATESVRLGSAPSSYLDVHRILKAVKQTGADCVHPGGKRTSCLIFFPPFFFLLPPRLNTAHKGYGFLSEDAKFASALIQNGMKWIGPSPSAMLAMGQKDNAKITVAASGVPIIPGYHGKAQDVSLFVEAAARVGYPVILKASFGGGGKGMRVVHSEADLPAALESAMSEASASFGESACVLEKLVQNAQHVEVQVFGDSHGNYVHLFERDCSTQRRHQKLLEEAPAPGLSEEVRAMVRQSAVDAARSVSYEGAGTVEFLVDPQTGHHYFLEMNTRLQVEHCVTEMLTGEEFFFFVFFLFFFFAP